MSEILFHSNRPQANGSSLLLEVTRETAGWATIDFRVHGLAKGGEWSDQSGGLECCLLLLKGECEIQLSGGPTWRLGPRRNVFASYPHAVYLPARTAFSVRALQDTELADGRVPSQGSLPPRLIEPRDCGFEIRGGGNATRQIVDVIPPSFPADRIMVCEVFTPSGNWSSFPPHKHDQDNPPFEVDLDEIYYYRFQGPEGFGYQRVYLADGSRDETKRVGDGDLMLIREGYHPFVTVYGHHAYYLNVLAGERRSLAASDDPSHAVHRRRWPAADPRLPLLRKPDGWTGPGETVQESAASSSN